jgi:hypothetical protein
MQLGQWMVPELYRVIVRPLFLGLHKIHSLLQTHGDLYNKILVILQSLGQKYHREWLM